MNTPLPEIPVVVENRPPQSGQKYKTDAGFSAIKDGVKSRPKEASFRTGKPKWLQVAKTTSSRYHELKKLVGKQKLSTVCEEAKCPNIGECWSHGTATIMLMGAVCTRACRFCSVDTGNPKGWLDANEPLATAQSIATMGLDYVVITSVDRDDLPDLGAGHYARTVALVKQHRPSIKVEVLTPDFQGKEDLVDQVIDAGVDVFAQNIETVRRLTHPVRDPRAGYDQTYSVLKYAKSAWPEVLTKTSIMLGLGETKDEIIETLADAKKANVDIITLGQYMQPTANHYLVDRYVPPEEFKRYREIGLEMGFYEVASGPMVRSSYRADRVFKRESLTD